MTRQRLYEILEPGIKEDPVAKAYNIIMMVMIFVSLVPLAFKEETPALLAIEYAAVSLFIVDYLLRWATADIRCGQPGNASCFVKHPFTAMAIIDLLSILPTFTVLNEGFRALRITRLLRLVRLLKAVRYSKSIAILQQVLAESKRALLAVGALAACYVLISALVVFNVEPESFQTFFDAVYWATISLTTVGYGDIYAVTTLGRIVTMISSVFGIAIVALPAGIITAGYMKALDIQAKTRE